MALSIDLFLFFFLFFFLPIHVLALSSASSEECPRFFECGNLGKLNCPLTTPQHGHCGMLPIHGCEDGHPSAEKTVLFGNRTFQVTGIGGPFNTEVSVRDKDLQQHLDEDDCEAFHRNITLPPTSPFGSFQIFPFKFMTFYRCNISLKVLPPKQFLNYAGCRKSHNETIFFQKQYQDDPPSSLQSCPRVQLPVDIMAFSPNPFTFITSEFSIQFQASPDCLTCVFYNGSSKNL